MVDLPAPVGPTSATVWPCSTVRVMPCRTGVPGAYENSTPSNRTSPRKAGAIRRPSRTSGIWASTAEIRSAQLAALPARSVVREIRRSGR